MLYNLKKKDIRNINLINEVFDHLLEWNCDKDLLLWPLHRQNFDNPQHSKVLFPLCSVFTKDSLPFETKTFLHDSNYEESLSNYNDNVFLSILYLEFIPEEYITIRNGNMNEINEFIDKEIIIFEVHCKSINSNSIYSVFQAIFETYLESIKEAKS